jgi:hypothetical protein
MVDILVLITVTLKPHKYIRALGNVASALESSTARAAEVK